MKVLIVLAIFAVGKLQFSDGLNLEVSGSLNVSVKASKNMDDVARWMDGSWTGDGSRSLKCTACGPFISRSYKKCANPYTQTNSKLLINAIYR